MAGIHALSSTTNYRGGSLSDRGKAISFFGIPGQTVVTHSGTGRDITCWNCTNAGTKAYNIVFRLLPSASQTVHYQVSLFGGQGSVATRGRMYHCFFTSANRMSMWYNDVSAPHALAFLNCSFLAPEPLASYTSAANATLTFHTCAKLSTIAYPTGSSLVNNQNSTFTGYSASSINNAAGVYSPSDVGSDW